MRGFRFILSLILLLQFSTAKSQLMNIGWDEVIVGVGPSNYFGDIGGATSSGMPVFANLNLFTKAPSYYAGVSYSVHPRFDLRLMGNYTNLFGSDAGSTFADKGRDYEFTSTIMGADLLVISTVFSKNRAKSPLLGNQSNRPKNHFNRRTGLHRKNIYLKMYLYAGLGYGKVSVSGNPSLVATDSYVSSSTTITIPMGAGIKHSISDHMYIGFEGGWKFNTGDYLDGRSTEASNVSDLFFTANVYVTYTFLNKKRL